MRPRLALALLFTVACKKEPTPLAAESDPIAACAEAMQRSLDQVKQGVRPGEKAVSSAEIQRTCAPVYKEASCREAVERASREPTGMTPFTTCRDAYCPKLAAPKPAVCAGEPSAAGWGELFEAIIRHDHGERGQPIVDAIRAGRVEAIVN